MAVAKTPTKRIKKQLKTLNKRLKAEKKRAVKIDRKVTAKTASLSKEMDKLKTELEKLGKKKTTKKQLSEYNLFMRRQLNSGKTFAQAVRTWKAYKKGKPLVKTKVVKKTVVRTVKAKPKIITRTRTVIRRIKAKPRVITRTVVRRVPVKRTVVRTVRVPAVQAEAKPSIKSVDTVISQLRKNGVEKMHFSDEEVAVKLTSLYFEEIARMGFKRQLELDDVINAYYHALSRIKAKNTEVVKETATNTNVTESKQ